MTEAEKEQYIDNRVEHGDHDNFLEEATVLVLKEMLGHDKAYADLMTGVSDETMFHLAYHVLQSNMLFAVSEMGDEFGMEKSALVVLAGWDQYIDPRMSKAWNALQAYHWNP